MARPIYTEPKQKPESLTVNTSVVIPRAYLTAIDRIIHLEWEISSHERRVSRLLQSRSAFIVEMVEAAIMNWCAIMADTFEPTGAQGEALYERIHGIIDAMPYHLRDRCLAAMKKHLDGNPVERAEALLEQISMNK